MAKTITQWENPELLLYLQSQINSLGMQLVKISHDTQKELSPDQEQPSLGKSIAKSLFNWETAQRSLLAKNPDVYVELFFPLEDKKDLEVMSYVVLQAKIVEWTRASVTVTWWPVNFKDHQEAKAFVATFMEKHLDRNKAETKVS